MKQEIIRKLSAAVAMSPRCWRLSGRLAAAAAAPPLPV